MHLVPASAGPPVLAHSTALAAGRPQWAFPLAHESCSLAETRQAPCPDRELVHSCGSACASDRAEPPLGLLRPQSCGYSPPARPDELSRREHQGPSSPLGTSGRRG